MVEELPAIDLFNLKRFLDAQESVYATVLQELKEGEKRSHWMWFIFPQIDGLVPQPTNTSKYYAIKNLEETRAFLTHPILGSRIRECTKLVNGLQKKTASQIFGRDDRKFFSSMTLFEIVAGPDSEFALALDKYFSKARDTRTHKILAEQRKTNS